MTPDDQCRAILARYIGKEEADRYKPLGVCERLAEMVDAYKDQVRISEELRTSAAARESVRKAGEGMER